MKYDRTVKPGIYQDKLPNSLQMAMIPGNSICKKKYNKKISRTPKCAKTADSIMWMQKASETDAQT